MGTVTTPIYGLTAPDDQEPLKAIGAAMRASMVKVEAALRSRGLAPADVTGYLDLVGEVHAAEDRITALEARPIGGGDTSKVAAITEAVMTTGWGYWLDLAYARLHWIKTKDNMVTVQGLAQTNAQFGPLKICGLPDASWAPRDTKNASNQGGQTFIFPGIFVEGFRAFDISTAGLSLRGAAPTGSGQYIAVNATYACVGATV
jgi:hypothetical protein